MLQLQGVNKIKTTVYKKMVAVLNFIKRVVCSRKGHNFEVYTFQTGYWSYCIEQAGYCKRCGFDTHEGLKEYNHSKNKT